MLLIRTWRQPRERGRLKQHTAPRAPSSAPSAPEPRALECCRGAKGWLINTLQTLKKLDEKALQTPKQRHCGRLNRLLLHKDSILTSRKDGTTALQSKTYEKVLKEQVDTYFSTPNIVPHTQIFNNGILDWRIFSDSTTRKKTSPKYSLLGPDQHITCLQEGLLKVPGVKYITKDFQSIQNKQHKQGKLKATSKDRTIGK